ncbi:MAG: hypothetical protein L6R42_004994 [Xanthoria sp. 1 TBL-2021]|nr:MAG: hypothetical protein L6R42_004994 [Xanthoria sp. 1 TBL-2021]
MKILLAENEPRVLRIRSILDRVLLACRLDHLEWTLIVLDTPDIANASVHPRGLVVWYGGMFTAAETDDEIATAISHEVAHVLAHHSQASASGLLLGALAMSPALPFVLGGLVFEELLLIAAPPIAIGVLILLALSREREAEADKIGMLLMTEAGFEPSATVTFWEKMGKLEQEMLIGKGEKQMAEYQSTHPHSMSTREIRHLEESKQRWETFLAQRPTHDGKDQSSKNEYRMGVSTTLQKNKNTQKPTKNVDDRAGDTSTRPRTATASVSRMGRE